jgi:hypothetical protein
MKEITPMQLVEKLKAMQDDPLTVLFIAQWKIGNHIIRLHCGDVQWRNVDDKYFSFGVPIKEFLEQAERLLTSRATS